MYTSSELNAFHPPKHPAAGDWCKASKASQISTIGENIPWRKLVHSQDTSHRNSPLHNVALANNGTCLNRSASIVSSPRDTRAEPRMSPPVGRTWSTSTTSVEVVLASCQPSLLHITSVLYSLGIKQREHLPSCIGMAERRNLGLRDERGDAEERCHDAGVGNLDG